MQVVQNLFTFSTIIIKQTYSTITTYLPKQCTYNIIAYCTLSVLVCISTQHFSVKTDGHCTWTYLTICNRNSLLFLYLHTITFCKKCMYLHYTMNIISQCLLQIPMNFSLGFNQVQKLRKRTPDGASKQNESVLVL